VRRNVSLTVLLCVIILAAAGIAAADVPYQMHYQGHLTDSDGSPLDTTISMTFTVYNDSSMGSLVLWTETQASVDVNAGLFSVILGSVIPIPDTVFADDWRWLGIQIASDPEIAPRTKLVSVPYAFQALRVGTVDGATGGDVYGNLRLHSYLYVGDYGGEAGQLQITDGTGNTIIAYGTTGSLNMEGDLDISGKATLGFGNTNTGSDAFVAGRTNTVSANYATVGGGFGNSATAIRSTVGGGMDNLAGAVISTVAGGQSDTASAPGATVGGGLENQAAGEYSSVSGGANNTAIGSYGTVSGGRNNTASLSMNTVGGGQYNTAGGSGSTISGGMQNDASGSSSTIGGGSSDTASGDFSAISGGRQNTASGDLSSLGGGYQNVASGDSATISGGSRNSATGNNSAVGGGTGNEAAFVGTGPLPDPLGGWSTVSGGRDNRALGDYSTVGGGQNNTAAAGWTATYGGHSTVAGGESNYAFAMHSTVGGGQLDSALAPYTTVGGGSMNVAGTGLLANPDSGAAATVAGGYNNRASGFYSAVGGGTGNIAGGPGSTVSGGENNRADSAYATVAGGATNTASGERSAIGGGVNNTAGNWASVVGGGMGNLAAGLYSTIPGGYADTLTSSAGLSMAFGSNVYVNNSYRVVFFDGTNSGRLGINRDDRDSGGIAYPIHVGTDASNGNGAYLTNGGSWMAGSSRSFKNHFRPLDSGELLSKISSLPVESWQYRETDERHIGPVSEDFVGSFDVGVIREDGSRDNKYLCPGDVAGVALAGVKELIRKNEELTLQNQELRDMLEKLAQRVNQLENGK